MASYLFIDVETTSLSKENGAIIELAAIPVINGEIKDSFHSMIRPHKDAHIDLKSFEITKIDVNTINSFPDAKEVLSDFIKWIDSHETLFSLAGHNINFDRNFLFRLFCRHGEYGSFITRFRNNDLDTLSLSRSIFKRSRNKPVDFKLESLCRYFGVEIGVSHRALEDINNTVRVYQELEKLVVSKIETPEKLSFTDAKNKYMDSKYVQFFEDGGVYIPPNTRKNKQAMEFILNQLWEMDCDSIQNLQEV